MNRLAQRSDINELSKLRLIQQKDDWKELYPTCDQEFYETTKSYLKTHLNKDIFFFIEVLDEQIVATCGLQIIELMPQCVNPGIEGFICDIFTLSEYRKKGIQTNLIKQCIDYASSNNVIELMLSSDNEEAISIYQKQGFEIDKLTFKKALDSDYIKIISKLS